MPIAQSKSQKVGHNSLSDTVYEFLYRQIRSGKFQPGQKITETQIAQSQEISRGPVREAMKRLAEDRLITLVPRSACYVCELPREEIVEIYDIRERLETLALEYAFNRFDKKKIEALRDKFNACRQLEGDKFIREEQKLDSQFHLLIYETSGRNNLQDILSRLHAKIEIFRAREAQTTRTKLALEHHIAILNAILAGEKADALQLLNQHIRSSREYILSSVG